MLDYVKFVDGASDGCKSIARNGIAVDFARNENGDVLAILLKIDDY